MAARGPHWLQLRPPSELRRATDRDQITGGTSYLPSRNVSPPLAIELLLLTPQNQTSLALLTNGGFPPRADPRSGYQALDLIH